MKHRLSKVFLSAAAFLLAGAMTLAQPVVQAGAATTFFGMDVYSYVTRTYQVSGVFTSIDISQSDANVTVVYDSRGPARVVSQELEIASQSVTVENGVLKIQNNPVSSGSYILYSSGEEPEVTVYLPSTLYDSLTFYSDSGSLSTSSRLTFDRFHGLTSSGEIELRSSVSGSLVAETGDGSILLKNLDAGSVTASTHNGLIHLQQVMVDGEAKLTTSDNDIHLTDTTVGKLTAKTYSGDILLDWVTILGNASIHSTTGDIQSDEVIVTGTKDVWSSYGKVMGDLDTTPDWSWSFYF